MFFPFSILILMNLSTCVGGTKKKVFLLHEKAKVEVLGIVEAANAAIIND
jgi:hypothetical protein